MGRSFGALQFINRGFRDEAIEVLEIAGLLVTPSRKNATANLRKGAKPLRHVKAARHRRGGKGEPWFLRNHSSPPPRPQRPGPTGPQ